MKYLHITTSNYFDTIKKIGFENLPLVLKQSHTVIDSKTDSGKDWSQYKHDADLKRMIDLVFKKLEEFIASEHKHVDGLEGTNHSSKKVNPYSTIAKECQFIERFLAFHDQILYKNTFGIFIDDLQRAIQEKKITKKSPVAKEMMEIQNALIKQFNTMQNATHFVLKPATINRLKGIVAKWQNAYDDLDEEYIKSKKKKIDLNGLNGIETIPENAEPIQIMSSTDFTNMKFNTIGFKDKWLDFIGDPAQGFTAMVFGMPKMGKSYLCMEFAGYLARHHGNVLYVAKEEQLEKTLQDKMIDKQVAHENLMLASALPTDLSAYDFIFIDSVNKQGLTAQDLVKLKAKNKGKSFIYVFQATKGGQFKGNNEFQHDVDIVIEIPERGKAVQFGRFNQGGEMAIFPDYVSEEDELSGIQKSKTMKKTVTKSDWTKPKYLGSSDWRDLKTIKDYCDEDNYQSAMSHAMNCDTVIREEIPSDIWKKMGGKLTPTGEEKLKNKTTEITSKISKNSLKPKTIAFTGGIRLLKGTFEEYLGRELTDADYIKILYIAIEQHHAFKDLITELDKNLMEVLMIMNNATKEWDKKGNTN